MPIQLPNGSKVKRLYNREGGTNTEIKLLQDNEGNVIHKRTNIIYADEDYKMISSETKTWGVERLNPPTPPTKPFHNFKHWESLGGGDIVGSSTLAPLADPVYMPVYVYNENYVADISVNGGSYKAYEWDGNYTWNGAPAFEVHFSAPVISIVGLKNNPSITATAGTTVDIESNNTFPKTIQNIYPVDAGYNGIYGATDRRSADLVYSGGNNIFWRSLGMPIGFGITDVPALIFVFENVD